MSDMREDSITVPPGVVDNTPWLGFGEKIKGIFEHQQSPFAEISKQATKQFRGLALQQAGFQEIIAKYGQRIAEIARAFQPQPREVVAPKTSMLPLTSIEVSEEHEEFMQAYRPYHTSGDETLLWEWIARQTGRKPDPILRSQLWFDYRDLGGMTPREIQEVLQQRTSELFANKRRMIERIVEDVRKRFRVYPKHEPVLEEYVESLGLVSREPPPRERIRSKREQALRNLIASALAARGDKLLLGDRIVGKVDYYITRELPPPKHPIREGKYAEQEDQDDEQGTIAYNWASWHTPTPRHESNVPLGQGMVHLDSTGEEGRGLLDVLHDPVDPYSGVETTIAVEQTIARAKLAPRELEVIKLRYLRELDRDEVAQYMGIKPKTVDELRLRGIHKLRAAL